MNHLIDAKDLSAEYVNCLISNAHKIIEDPTLFIKRCESKILASLFFEPSTRTRLSFESAMYGLGGSVIGFSSADSSSTMKGESLADTIRMVSAYADICVIRHPKEGAALLASRYSNIPVINAGDGGHQHPTQTLTDLLTIFEVKGRLSNMTVGLCGDLKFGRTVHSLIEAMSQYENVSFVLVSPEELQLPKYLKSNMRRKNISFTETTGLDESIGDMDILYMTRVQKERFFNEADYVRLKDTYILDNEKLSLAKKDMAILHPLPRVNEIAQEVDSDPRAIYFKQAEYGRYIRMALIMNLLGIQKNA